MWERQALRLLAVFCVVSAAAFAQAPTVAAVQNLADFSTNLCPGLNVVIYGANFGPSTTGSTAPVTGVTVTVGTTLGFVAAVAASNQLVAQIPVNVPAGATTITVAVGGVASAPFPITLKPYAPAFYTFAGTGTGSALATNSAEKLLTSTVPANPGDTVTLYVAGLGATNPATPTGPAPLVVANTVVTPTLTIGGLPATVISSIVAPGYAGEYQINAKIPPGLQGNAPMVLTIGGISSSPISPVTLPLFGITDIVSNASYGSAGTAAVCSIATLFGNGFGTTSQTTGFPATAFQGVSVTFNGTAAPLFHLSVTAATASTVGQAQIDLLIPCELPTSGTVEVALTSGSAISPNYTLTMAAGAPGLYFLADPSVPTRFNVLAQFNATVWLAMPASMATALKLPGNCTANMYSPLSLCGQPAAPGDYLVLYATGLGLVTPNGDPTGQPLPTGSVPPANGSVLYETVATPTVTVGGFPVKVLFSGMQPGNAGLYQIDFQVPTGITGDDVPVTLSISGSPTDTRTISIQANP